MSSVTAIARDLLLVLLGLFAFANFSLVTAPLLGAVTLLTSQMVPAIARQSPRYIGLSLGIAYGLKTYLRAETRGFVLGWKRAAQFARDRVQTGWAPWEVLAQKATLQSDAQVSQIAPVGFVGKIYHLITSPAVEAEYIRSLNYRAAFFCAQAFSMKK
jgi:hypothetical protein